MSLGWSLNIPGFTIRNQCKKWVEYGFSQFLVTFLMILAQLAFSNQGHFHLLKNHSITILALHYCIVLLLVYAIIQKIGRAVIILASGDFSNMPIWNIFRLDKIQKMIVNSKQWIHFFLEYRILLWYQKPQCFIMH